MFALLEPFRGLLKLHTLTVDNLIFRLHCRFTVGILAVFSLVVTYTQFFGESIACTESKSQHAPKHVVEPFCWIHSTFSVREAFDLEPDDEKLIYPGVKKKDAGDEKIEHAYYQWVCFVLALQAILFYMPHYLWKALEGDRLKNLVMGLNIPALHATEVRKKQVALVGYLQIHKGMHQGYFFKYIFCECLNIINIIGQMYLLNEFFGGQFNMLGTRVIRYASGDPSENIDPLIRVFPRMTKCTFFHYGSSGDKPLLDFLCILPLNVIYEKIFLFIWFWFVLLLTISSLGIVYRVVMCCVPILRKHLLRAKLPTSETKDLDTLTDCLPLGDWFILYQLAKNIDQFYMADIVHKISEGMQTGVVQHINEPEQNFFGKPNRAFV